MSKSKQLAVVFGLVVAGCGGAQATTPASSNATEGTSASSPGTGSSEAAPPTAGTESRAPSSGLRLGHYTTIDMKDGFVLDRTGSPWLLKRDGSGAVVELHPDGESEYRSPDRSVWLRTYSEGWNGGRILYDGPDQHEGIDVMRDASACPLRGGECSVDAAAELNRARVGHYSTEDARDGFVLDQRGTTWLFKRDGSTAAIPLTEAEHGHDASEWRSADQSIWLRYYYTGRLMYDGPEQREGVDVVRDAAAEPLSR